MNIKMRVYIKFNGRTGISKALFLVYNVEALCNTWYSKVYCILLYLIFVTANILWAVNLKHSVIGDTLMFLLSLVSNSRIWSLIFLRFACQEIRKNRCIANSPISYQCKFNYPWFPLLYSIMLFYKTTSISVHSPLHICILVMVHMVYFLCLTIVG